MKKFTSSDVFYEQERIIFECFLEINPEIKNCKGEKPLNFYHLNGRYDYKRQKEVFMDPKSCLERMYKENIEDGNKWEARYRKFIDRVLEKSKNELIEKFGERLVISTLISCLKTENKFKIDKYNPDSERHIGLSETLRTFIDDKKLKAKTVKALFDMCYAFDKAVHRYSGDLNLNQTFFNLDYLAADSKHKDAYLLMKSFILSTPEMEDGIKRNKIIQSLINDGSRKYGGPPKFTNVLKDEDFKLVDLMLELDDIFEVTQYETIKISSDKLKALNPNFNENVESYYFKSLTEALEKAFPDSKFFGGATITINNNTGKFSGYDNHFISFEKKFSEPDVFKFALKNLIESDMFSSDVDRIVESESFKKFINTIKAGTLNKKVSEAIDKVTVNQNSDNSDIPSFKM